MYIFIVVVFDCKMSKMLLNIFFFIIFVINNGLNYSSLGIKKSFGMEIINIYCVIFMFLMKSVVFYLEEFNLVG